MTQLNLSSKIGIFLLSSVLSFYSCSRSSESIDPTIIQQETIDLGIENDNTVALTEVIGSDKINLENHTFDQIREEAYSGLESYISQLQNNGITQKDNHVYMDYKKSLQFLYVSIPENTSFSLNLQDILMGGTVYDTYNVQASVIDLNDYTHDITLTTFDKEGAILLKLFPQYYDPSLYDKSSFNSNNASFYYPEQYDSLTLGTENFSNQLHIINIINKQLIESNNYINPIDIIQYIAHFDYSQYTENPAVAEEIALNTIKSNGIPTMKVAGYNKENSSKDWFISYIGNYGWVSSNPKIGEDLFEFNNANYAIQIAIHPLPDGVYLYPISISELQNGISSYFSQIEAIRDQENLLHFD